MFKNRLKEMIRKGQPAIGTFIAFSDPHTVEVMADIGFDWFFIDTEHCTIGMEGLRDILVAMKGSHTVPVVRLMNNQPDYFKVALDLGAEGVIVPMIESAEDARRAVQYCRYPPLGTRGFGPVRASRYHLYLDEYAKAANAEILLVAQIESHRAIQELDAILAVSGIDAIFIGQADLTSSMNLIGQWGHPEVKAAIDQIIRQAKKVRMPFGTPASSPEDFAEYVARGATLMTVGGDLEWLQQAALDSLKRTKSLLESRGYKGFQEP